MGHLDGYLAASGGWGGEFRVGGGDGEIIAEKDWKDGEDGGGITVAMALVVMSRDDEREEKEKVYLPECVEGADCDGGDLAGWGEPMNEPFANRKAQEEVEKAFMKWGRYRLALDTNTADLVIAVLKGTGKVANPTINGGPVDTRPGTIETTDDQIRVGVQQGRPPDVTQQGAPTGTDRPNEAAIISLP